MGKKKLTIAVVVGILLCVGVLYGYKNNLFGAPAKQNTAVDNKKTEEPSKDSAGNSGTVDKEKKEEPVAKGSGFDEGLKIEDKPFNFYAGKNINLDELKKAGKPILLNFSWEDCAPCKYFNPILEKAYDEYKGKLVIKNIEVYKSGGFTSEFPVRATPTQIFLKPDGQAFEFSKEIMEKHKNQMAMLKSKDGKQSVTVHQGVFNEKDLAEIITAMGIK